MSIIRGRDLAEDIERDFLNAKTGLTSRTEEKLELYVDATNGNDDNPGTEDSPFKTFTAVEHAVPEFVQHDVVVHFKSGTYAAPKFRARKLGARLVFIGDDFEELEPEQEAQAGSSDTEVVAAAGLGTDTHRGLTIEILTGDAAGDRRTIRDHTDTTITPVEEFSATVADGDTFRIVRPAAEIEVDTGDNSFMAPYLMSGYGAMEDMSSRVPRGANNAAVHFVNLRFIRDPDAEEPYAVFVRSAVVFAGCEVSGANGALVLHFHRSDISSGFDTFLYYKTGVDLLGAPDLQSWRGWGLTACASVSAHALTLSSTIGRLYYVCASLWAEDRSDIRLAGGNIFGRDFGSSTSLFADEGSRLRVSNGVGDATPTLITAIESRDAIEARNNSHIRIDGAIITADTGYGIISKDRSLVKVGGDVEINAGDVGMRAESGAQIHFADGLTITASGNETELDDGTTQSLGSYDAPGGANDSLVRGTAPNNGTAIVRIS